jgi:ABC-type polar amino acid transport system ATPase subunit
VAEPVADWPIVVGDESAAQVPSWTDALTLGGEITIHGVSKSFGALKVLDDVTLTVPQGSVTVILGQSGSGKSTLLRAINHLERVDDGFIAIDGELIGYRRDEDTLYELHEKEILKRRVDVGMVFQNFNLFPHLTVLENIVEAPVSVRGLSRPEAEALASELLVRVGLADKTHAYPRQLSGGQQQRVAIARALALKPKVLLFDEPTSALDPELVGEVLAVIKELARSGTTLVIVTHEIGFAREVADTIVFMERAASSKPARPRKCSTRRSTRAPPSSWPRFFDFFFSFFFTASPLMTHRRNILSALVVAAFLLPLAASAQLPPATDLSPEQAGRPRAQKLDEAIKLAKDFKFLKEGVLVVGTTTGRLPFAAYATDTKTPVGNAPDIAQLVADSLGPQAGAGVHRLGRLAAGPAVGQVRRGGVERHGDRGAQGEVRLLDLPQRPARHLREVRQQDRCDQGAEGHRGPEDHRDRPAPTRSRSCCAGTSRMWPLA